jgi:tellurite resistance protein
LRPGPHAYVHRSFDEEVAMTSTISHHTALIYTMVLMSAADSDMTDQEMFWIGEITRTLPVFQDYDSDHLTEAAEDCADILGQEDGLDAVIGLISEALPEKLRETAYAIACDVAAADGIVTQEELRLLEFIRYNLQVGRLPAAAIERGARARHTRL